MSSQFKRLLSISSLMSSPVRHWSQSVQFPLSSSEFLPIRKYSTTVYSSPVPAALVGTAIDKDGRREFMTVFPDIVRDLTEAGEYLDIQDVTEWYAKVLQYNVPGGKLNRGLDHVSAYRICCDTMKTSPDMRLAHVTGWCIEMFQAFELVMDDIMDAGEMRRGRECWYRFNNNGNIAINDIILVENGIYFILKKYFRDKSYYKQVLELFHDITLKTSMGQCLDELLCKSFKQTKKLDIFTIDRLNAIAKYKTAYYTYQLPVSLAMLMSGISDEERHMQAKRVLLEMGIYYQFQDDYLNCFGQASSIGKSIGTDIQDGKCTWLLITALQRANARQREKLEECYGREDAEHIEAVQSVYKEIGLPSIYAAYEEDTYNMIVTHVQQLPRGLPHEVFFKILDKIYKRRR